MLKEKLIKYLEGESYQMSPYGGGEAQTVMDLDDISSVADSLISLLSEDFQTACVPVSKYLSENHNPHTEIVVREGEAEILESVKRITKIKAR